MNFENLCQMYGDGKISAKEFDRRCKEISGAEHELDSLHWSRLLAMRTDRLKNLIQLDCPRDIIFKEFEMIQEAFDGVQTTFRSQGEPTPEST